LVDRANERRNVSWCDLVLLDVAADDLSDQGLGRWSLRFVAIGMSSLVIFITLYPEGGKCSNIGAALFKSWSFQFVPMNFYTLIAVVIAVLIATIIVWIIVPRRPQI
jgi:hypothetical protein